MCVAKNSRPPGADIINVLVAVNVPHARALSFVDEERLSTDSAKRTHWRIHASGNVFERFSKELFGARARNHFEDLITETLSGKPASCAIIAIPPVRQTSDAKSRARCE